MKIVVILPTYNEKENITRSIDAIFAQSQGIIPHELHILVVDDHSPDGTGAIVEALIAKRENLHLITGDKNGLGDAYVRGFKATIQKLHADVVVEMDADGQHPAEMLPKLITALDNGADVAVGTRYIEGGSIPKTWGFLRRFLSNVGNIIARTLLLMPQYHDMTTGFRATRTTALKRVNVDGLLSKRFAYKIHLYHALHVSGANIVEVPFEFVDRSEGASKMITNDIYDSLRVIFLIRIHESRQLIKFLTVGAIGFTINAALLKLLYDTPIGNFLAVPETPGTALFIPLKDTRLFWSTVISAEASIFSNFLFHENWTFKNRNKNGNGILRFLRFNASSVVSPLISIATVNILTPTFGLPKLIALGIGTLLGLIWNYSVNVLWIWRSHPQDKGKYKRE